MVFGSSYVKLSNESGFTLGFTAKDSLAYVSNSGPTNIKVAAHNGWM